MNNKEIDTSIFVDLINKYDKAIKIYSNKMDRQKEDYQKGVCHGLMVGFMQAKNLLNSFLTNIENKKDELNWVDFKKNNGGN